jgi:hypothetical protein
MERWRRAGFYATVTALVVGLATVAVTVNSTQPHYLRMAAVAFVASVAILVTLTVAWFGVLKLWGR